MQLRAVAVLSLHQWLRSRAWEPGFPVPLLRHQGSGLRHLDGMKSRKAFIAWKMLVKERGVSPCTLPEPARAGG